MNPIIYVIFVIAVFTIEIVWMKKQHRQMRAEKDTTSNAAAADFYSTEADLKQHLRDDGFIEPKPGSEEHFQKWKAERNKNKEL